VVEARDFAGDLLLRDVQARVVAVLRMAEALSPKYHVVVANPPYANAKGLNPKLNAFLRETFPNSRSDLMTSFMERAGRLSTLSDYWGMINLPAWMFLGTFENCRTWLLSQNKIGSLVHLGRGVFGSDFGSVAFVARNNKPNEKSMGIYRRLLEKQVSVRKIEEIEKLFQKKDYGRYSARQIHFSRISGKPIIYWLGVASRTVVWLSLEQRRFEFVPVFHGLQGRLAAQG